MHILKHRFVKQIGILVVLQLCAFSNDDNVFASDSWIIVPNKEFESRDSMISDMREDFMVSNPKIFSACIYKDALGGELPYRIFKPKIESTKQRYPLILMLHGSGGRGNDNITQINKTNLCVAAGIWASPVSQMKNPCFVLVPQCPKSKSWYTTKNLSEPYGDTLHSFNANPSSVISMVVEIINQLEMTEAIDTNRIYVFGASMGGTGTWDIITRNPQMFAAAIPICGEVSNDELEAIKDIPIWIFHGNKDEGIPYSISKNAYSRLKAEGGSPIFTEYDEGGHHILPYAITEPGLVQWLFSQNRNK
jgi:predicted peptidase